MQGILCFDAAARSFPLKGGGELKVVGEISFSVQQGEVLSLVGPSGCGKSTLLRLAAGLDTPTSGRVLYRGRPVLQPGLDRGLVFQTYNAFPWLTVRQNVAFGLTRVSESERRPKVDYWLESTGLLAFADDYPKTLSGGMRQRLALARTLIVEPELLLLDEPFGALDEPVRRTMQATLLELVERVGCTVLFVTHDIAEAIFVADRVLLMTARPGRIAAELPVDHPRPRGPDLYSNSAFVAAYEQILSLFPNSLTNN